MCVFAQVFITKHAESIDKRKGALRAPLVTNEILYYGAKLANVRSVTVAAATLNVVPVLVASGTSNVPNA